jgi:bacteriorhodopsin
VQCIAVTFFGINGCLQMSSTFFQRLEKKRQLNSLVLFINLVPFVTNICSITNKFPEFKAADGRPVEYLHVVQWMFTTPCMIMILSSLGTSMRKSLVFSWKVTLKAIMWDEIMLITGIISFFSPHPFHWIFHIISMLSFGMLLWHIHGIVQYAVKNSGTTFEAYSITVLEVCLSLSPCLGLEQRTRIRRRSLPNTSASPLIILYYGFSALACSITHNQKWEISTQ